MPSKSAPPAAGVAVAGAPLSSALLQLVRAHAALATRRLHQLGLAPPQELVLLYLEDHGRCAQRELVTYLGRDRSTVTATIQAMQRAELITRSVSGTDRRVLVVELTGRGAELCPRVRAVWEELETVTFGGVEAPKRAVLAEVLSVARDHVAAVLEQPVEQPLEAPPTPGTPA